VRGSATVGPRRLDAVILPNRRKRSAKAAEVSLKGEDAIIVQAKASRLGMYLMGLTLFSAQLVGRYRPSSIRSVALCLKDDEILRPMLERYPGMQVVVMAQHRALEGVGLQVPRQDTPCPARRGIAFGLRGSPACPRVPEASSGVTSRLSLSPLACSGPRMLSVASHFGRTLCTKGRFT
jgi:hypothetical protein